MKYFGTDGIRGVADEFLTVSLAEELGRSMQLLQTKKIVIGLDTRDSSMRLAKGVEKGALEVGIDVAILGVCPTPLLAYASQLLQCHGIMITASHNPYQDNGLKVFFAGKKLFLEAEALLEKGLNHEVALTQTPVPGRQVHHPELIQSYLDLYQPLLKKQPWRVAFDFANGATSYLGPRLFESIFEHVEFIGIEPNGFNINKNVGSTHLEAIRKVILEKQLDFGFAFDGDGDRLLMVNSLGQEINGDNLIYIIANYLHQHHLLYQDTVVCTKMSNLGMIAALKERGIATIQTDVGDKYVIDTMDQFGYQLGGENSGHVINRQLINTGDGMLNAAYIMMILAQSKQTIDELSKGIHWYPDRLVNLKNMNRELVKHPEIVALVKQIEEELGQDGKILVRASGTEPLIRISCSARSNELVDHYIQLVQAKLQSF